MSFWLVLVQVAIPERGCWFDSQQSGF